MKSIHPLKAGIFATSTLLSTVALSGASPADAHNMKTFSTVEEVIQGLNAIKHRTNTPLHEEYEAAPVEESIEIVWEGASDSTGEPTGASDLFKTTGFWEDEPQLNGESAGPIPDRIIVETFDRNAAPSEYERWSAGDDIEDTTGSSLFSTAQYRPAPSRRYQTVRPQRAEASVSSMEREILDLVNSERARRGLRPLSMDGSLCRVGRDHSRDMARRNYFSHYTPEGDSVSDRVMSRGIGFQMLGENIALDYSARNAHINLMRSRGHRENILRRDYRRVGIGVAVSPRGEILVTQVFSS
ncbi:MAG: CAP domain-containing protein [Armatimonadetes bacterium]|nr:CAP domain-containing protein [Armatimonadota bacterium]